MNKPTPTILDKVSLVSILEGDFLQTDHIYSIFYPKSEHGETFEVLIRGIHFKEEIILNEDFNCPFVVSIEECTFEKKVNFGKGNFQKHVSLSRNRFQSNVAFYDQVSFESVSIYNASFHSDLYFGGGTFENVHIGNCSVNDVAVTGGRFKAITFDGQGIKEVHVYNAGTFIGSLGFCNNLRNTEITVANISVNRLYIAGKYDSTNSIQIENVNLHSLKFNLLTNTGRLYFNNIKVFKTEKELSSMTIDQFFESLSKKEIERILDYQKSPLDQNQPLHTLTLPANDELWNRKQSLLLRKSSSEKKSILEIDRVQVGAMEFKNFELEKFDRIIIKDTDLSQLKTFNSIFPTKKIEGNHHTLYEIFNDLYSTAKAKNNKREQIEYYNASKDALLKSFCNRQWYLKVPSISSLLLSKLYSNYGSRWPQALFTAIPLVAFAFFSSMMLSTSYNIDFSEEGVRGFSDLAVYFLQYLNPAHKLEFMDGKINGIIFSDSFAFVLFDMLGRIFIGIGIYETILSFRKYVRN